MIQIIATSIVKEEKRSFFLEAAHILVKESRKEKGNISYGLFQDTKNPEILTFIEEWKSIDAINFHKEANHFKINVPKLIESRESNNINLYNQLI